MVVGGLLDTIRPITFPATTKRLPSTCDNKSYCWDALQAVEFSPLHPVVTSHSIMKISTASIMRAATLLPLLLVMSTTGSMARGLHQQQPTTALSIAPATSSGTASARASSSWASAMACKNSPGGTTKVVKDKQGNPWGFEDNVSCAFRCEHLGPGGQS